MNVENAIIMQSIIDALDASNNWKVRVDACVRIIEHIAFDIPILLPALTPLLCDAKSAVRDHGLLAMTHVCSHIGNKDIDGLIPSLIETMMDPQRVEETIHKLSATTFVQQVTAATLCVIVPLLQRALTTPAKVVQRKACVIIENMVKLVDDPADVQHFLPSLVPLVLNVQENAASPDVREVAARALATLERIVSFAKTVRSKETDHEDGEDLCNCEFSLAYGAKILLKKAQLHMKRGKVYGLCGPNGVGKSTLLRAINKGQLDGFPHPDVLKTVYVEHDIDGDASERTVFDYVCSEQNDAAHVRQTLINHGFSEAFMMAAVGSLSGGWKMKLALTKAMLMKPDILMLDEPTNHLDVTNVAWLETYLQNLSGISCIIVSHDSKFLDTVCTHIIHYTDFKLHVYIGNLSAFVAHHPEAKSYYELDASPMSFKFPEPGFLEGVKTKERAIVKLNQVSFSYSPEKSIFENATLQCALNSRVAVLGPNGAGKSTLIKVLVGELEPSSGSVWRHPNLRVAYMAQHAFHHLEKHLTKTPMQYMQWRYATGEDRESEDMASRQLTEEERARIEAKFTFNGEKRVIEVIVSRRKLKRDYEYEVKWKDMTDDKNTWFLREDLEEMGFTKWVQEMDQKEATRLGMITRALTAANVAQQFQDMGLDPEIALHSHISGLSGGQKVKVVLAAAMWLNPHLLILDEPTNYLDRDSLGALAHAIKAFGGGVLIITHHNEFSSALCQESWTMNNGRLDRSGAQETENIRSKDKVGGIGYVDEITDAFGNIIKIKAPPKTLSNKDRKKKQKERKARRERGEIVSSDDDDEDM